MTGTAMTRRTVLESGLALTLGALARPAQAGALPWVQVWRDPACDCCEGWVRHMRDAGFTVMVHDTEDMEAIRRGKGVPEELASCHTATLGTYVIEGHVPASDITRLLAERPAARGLAAPGMPASAPGMDIPGEPYEVVLFGAAGGPQIYARH